MTDREAIEYLHDQVKKLQKELDELRRQYDGHTHDTESALSRNNMYHDHEMSRPR